MRYLLVFFFFLNQICYSQLVINEYSAANYSYLTDSYGQNEDWFEIYNNTASNIDLNGYYLSDKSDNLTKFQISSSIIINANNHLMVYASGNNEVNINDIHTNFKLHQTKGNEWIILTSPDGLSIVDSIFVLPSLTDHSRGRLNDADDQWGVFVSPSPNASNINAALNYSETPEFSYSPGNYSGTINLELLSDDTDVNIYYTIDGSVPTSTSSLYNTPIVLSTTTVVKTISISNNLAFTESFMEYGTFFINDTYTIPVMSVSGDQVDNLLEGNGWIEPHGTFEYYRDGIIVDKASGEFNKHGNDSWAYNQRGFDYITRDQFGYNYAIKDELFRTKDRDKYQRLIIKAAANDNYPFSYGGSGAHIRDSYVQSLSQVADLRMDERSFEPCILFLNGEYWGLYEIREKVDDIDFTDYYYDQDNGDVDYLKTWGGTWIEYGTDTGWTNIRDYILTNDMSVQQNYNHVKSFYNTGSLIDYFILNSYVVNADWLNWNTAWWRGTNPDGDKKKWRYTLWDMDNTFGHGTNYTGVPSQSPNSDPCDPESIGDPGGQGHIPIWNALLGNDEFFADYINRWTDLSNNYFSCDYLISHLDSLIDIIEPEMPMQIAKWGGNMTAWENNVQDMRDFIDERCEVINSGILDCYEDDYGIEGPYNITIIIDPPLTGEVEMNGFNLTDYPFSGSYFGGINQELEAQAIEEYVFDYWQFSNNTPNPDINSDQINYSLSSNDTIIAHFVPHTQLTLNVSPSLTGDVSINETLYNTFPTTITLFGEATIEATPIEGYIFDYWELSDGIINDENNASTTIFISEDATLTAYYTPLEFDVLFGISHIDGAVISVDGDILTPLPQTRSFVYDQSYNITIEVDDNFVLNHWLSINDNIVNPISEDFNLSLQETDTIIANLDELFKLSFIVEPENSGIVLGNGYELELFPASQKYIDGTELLLQAIPSIDMELKYWTRENAILEQNVNFDYLVEHDDTLRVIFNEKDLTLFIPNSFTPNGDFNNDVFKPIADPSKVKDYQMLIFNEWGELVFESENIATGWDGLNVDFGVNNLFIYKIIVYSKLTEARFEYMGTVLVL